MWWQQLSATCCCIKGVRKYEENIFMFIITFVNAVPAGVCGI